MKLDEGVLAIAGGVALGLLVLKVVGKIFGVGLEGALDNLSKMNEIVEALVDVVYDAIKDIQIEQA